MSILSTSNDDPRGIAIIGMSGRFPGSPTLERFEANLRDGADLISWFEPGINHENDSAYVGARGVLEGAETFDHVYFGMSPAEAALVDPQQRIFLQCAAHALGAAGYDPERYSGDIGVYAGVSTNTYVINNVHPNFPKPTTGERFQIMVANDKDYLSTRLSYRLNLRGPSYSIQTACSTSLVAVHQACQGLLTGECDIALAGAATLRTPQHEGYVYEEGLVFSKSGRVRPFDDAADGTVMSNGVGVIVLKPLAAALADGDTIHAVIRGTAVNNDGSFKASYAAPSRTGQADVILDALTVADLNARDISYVEAHGTGTKLGDPVEISALTAAFTSHTQDRNFCALGSVKSNFGHLDSAAGIAGLIKTVLMLRSKTLFPSRGFSQPNRAIAFDETPFRVCDQLVAWDTDGRPRRAGISSFGVGGTNAHLIIEEAPTQRESEPDVSEQTLVLSAFSEDALRQTKADIASWLRDNPLANFADVCFSLAMGRREGPRRVAIPCAAASDAIALLDRSMPIDDHLVVESRPLKLIVTDASPAFLLWARWAETHDRRFQGQLHDCLAWLSRSTEVPFFENVAFGPDSVLTRFVALYVTLSVLLKRGLQFEHSHGQGIGTLALAAMTGDLELGAVMTALAADPELTRPEVMAQQLAAIASLTVASSTTGEHFEPAYWQAVLQAVATRDDEGWRKSDMNSIMLVLGAAVDEPLAGGGLVIGVRSGQSSAGLIGTLWCAGAPIDWSSDGRNGRRCRLPLPDYPFAKGRHWLDPPCAVETTETIDAARRQPALLDTGWHAAPTTGRALSRSCVGVLYTRRTRDLAAAIAARFDSSNLFELEGLQNQPLGDLAHLDAWIDVTGCDADHHPSVKNILAAAGALAGFAPEPGKDPPGFILVTSDLKGRYAVGALGASLCRSLSQELPLIRIRHCEMDDLSTDDAAELIASEVCDDSTDAWVRYRDGVRQAPHLSVAPAAATDRCERLSLENDTALITGGGGGLGLLVARRLASVHGVTRIILGLRSALPPREEWSGNLSISHRRTVSAIVDLESQGVMVRTIAFTLDDPAEFKATLDEAQAVLGPVRIVIHAAGTADLSNTRFLSKSTAAIDRVLKPKMSGLAVLHDSLDSDQLKRVLLFSSVAALIPSLASGQSDYAMANAYLDATSADGVLFGGKAVSIRWPSWRDTGMGEAKSAAYVRTGLLSLTNEEGLTFFDAILTSSKTGIVSPAIIDPATFNGGDLLSSDGWSGNGKDMPSCANERHDVAPPVDLLALIRRIAAGVLMIQESDLDENLPLEQYGADSILLAQMAKRMSEGLRLDLDVAILLQHRTVGGLSAWASRQLGEDATSPAGPFWAGDDPPPIFVAARGVVSPTLSPVHDLERIAVIGMSCRFPGAPNLDAFWEMMGQGVRAINPVPESRWRKKTPYFAGLIEDIDCFDNTFFGLSTADVAAMDPQALLLLEETLSAIYHAGYDQDELRGERVGVYVGARGREMPDDSVVAQSDNPILATSQNCLASNISQFFDFQGPSLVVDTACSSAIVAMDLAAAALRSGEVDLAIVAGVNFLGSPRVHDLFARRGILAEGKDFHIIDQRGSGVVLGEGVGVVVLRSLPMARDALDRVYAIIEGIAVNNDGRTAGPTTPNFAMQKQVMERALAQSGRTPDEVVHIDLNGSGSEVTDLLELRAIEAVYREGSVAACSLGSVKPHIGHSLCAHGMASFVKVVLMLHRATIPPFLSGQQPLRHYKIEDSPFIFHRTTTSWPGGAAAVSAFADGGTNAHVIVSASA